MHSDVPDLLSGDPLRLQQILTNLTANAIKFTEQGNIDVAIFLRKRIENQRVRLSIQIRIPASA